MKTQLRKLALTLVGAVLSLSILAACNQPKQEDSDNSFAKEINSLSNPDWKPQSSATPVVSKPSVKEKISKPTPEPQAAQPEEISDGSESSESVSEPFLTTEEVSELNRSAALPAPKSRSFGSRADPQAEPTKDDSVPEIIDFENKPDADLPYVDGQGRGYALLSLMQPEARLSITKQLQTLYNSKVKNPVISVLIDGTFGWDPSFFKGVIQKLNEDGRRLTLVIYLTNGPTMRKFETTRIRTAFSTINPKEFRKLIRSDFQVRTEFEHLAQRAQSMFVFNRSINPQARNIAIVMLEDNLDAKSYKAARELAGQVISRDVMFLRNQCMACWPGNDFDPQGDGLEFHTTQEMNKYGGYGFSLDGVGFHHVFERGPGPNSNMVKTFIHQSIVQGVKYFQLWRHDRQGIYGSSEIEPRLRKYAVPTEAQMQAEIELLREGLS